MKFALWRVVFPTALLATAMVTSPVFAAGDANRGKVLFNDAKAFGGQQACSSCHPNGKGLEKAAGKKEYHVAGGTQHSLEEAVNTCIVSAAGGKAIDPASQKMQDIVSYIASLKGKMPGY